MSSGRRKAREILELFAEAAHLAQPRPGKTPARIARRKRTKLQRARAVRAKLPSLVWNPGRAPTVLNRCATCGSRVAGGRCVGGCR